MIVRWGLDALPAALAEAGVSRPLLVASPRWDGFALGVETASHWREVPSTRVDEAAALASGGVLALGGGSALDLAKAISATAEVPLVSVPTTYSGAEWTSYYGIRTPERRMAGHGAGARPTAIVYEPRLFFDLPLQTTVGTAMNALAHCAEALYVTSHNEQADADALAGAPLVVEWLPRVVADPHDLAARTELLRGASHGGAALATARLALGHAMAQAVGGFYGAPHGTLNGILMPAALRYNAQWAPEAIARFADAIGGDPGQTFERLTALGGITRLRELGVRADDIPELAELAAARAGNQANPHPATPDEIAELLRPVY